MADAIAPYEKSPQHISVNLLKQLHVSNWIRMRGACILFSNKNEKFREGHQYL